MVFSRWSGHATAVLLFTSSVISLQAQTTAPLVVRAGATVLVGSAIFGDREGVAAAMNRLRRALNEVEDETEPAELSARQRSQLCSLE